MKKDLLLTFVTQGLVLICGLLVYRVVNQHLGNDDFALYALCRRTHSFLFPALAVGCGVAIPRYIAFAEVQSKENSDSYFKTGALIVLSATLLFMLVVNVFSSTTSSLLFSDAKLFYLVFPLSVMMAGYALHTLVYAYYRGHSRMVSCNLLQIVNMAFVPLVMACLTAEPETMLLWTGLGWLGIAAAVLLVSVLPKLNGRITGPGFREMALFGVQRVPSDFGFAALFGLPAIMTAHASGAVAGGHVAFGISLLSMCGAVFQPIGLVLLPKASAAIARNDSMLINRYLRYSLAGSFVVSLGMYIAFAACADLLLPAYLGGNVPPNLVATARTVMLAAVPYAMYVASRSIIDSFFVFAVNTLNVSLALFVFVVLAGMLPYFQLSTLSPLNSLVVSLYFLAVATLISCLKIMGNHKIN